MDVVVVIVVVVVVVDILYLFPGASDHMISTQWTHHWCDDDDNSFDVAADGDVHCLVWMLLLLLS